jgi:hypothetical protein
MPWEISVALAGAALLALSAVAAVTVLQLRQTLSRVAELSGVLDRHLPSIERNLEEIRHHAEALKASIEALSEKTEETGRGLEGVAGGVQDTVRTLEQAVLEPLRKTARGLSTLLAVGAALRGLRHPFAKVLPRRRKSRA